ncbi:MAG: hypothetical protein AAB262_03720, partial [Elusimicrobiota bacterium]
SIFSVMPPRRAKPVKKAPKKSGADALLEEYYPIVEGRVYRYRYESAEWPQKSTATMKVRSVRSAGGKTTAIWEETNPNPPDERGPAVRRWGVERSAKGVVEGEKDGSYWVIRTPLKKGTSWQRNDGATFTITSLTERVKVPAGVYANCLLVTYENEGIGTGALYYAKGVGLVRSIQRGEWVPYDYWLKSVSDEKAVRLKTARAVALGRPRLMMALKSQRGTA